MRDLVVREGLEAMAREAAKLLRELVAAGEEIPYEVREPGNGSPICQYEPLTAQFVRDHAAELRELDAFGSACAALESAGLAGHYLEQMGVSVPHDPRARSELAATAFLCRLWTDSSDFSLDAERLDAAIAEIETGGEIAGGEIEVAVPLRGFHMPAARLEVGVATIVRADTVEVPSEARVSEGMGASPWEPVFLAVARVELTDEAEDEEDVDVGLDATERFRRLVSTLRLFKAGGVGLGPYAWTRVGGDRWRRIATGAGKPRPGGYRIDEDELAELTAFGRALASPSTPFGRTSVARRGLPEALARAVSRFEAGLERSVAVEALPDNLLALRFVLEGGGPADLGLSMRVAALCADPDRRSDVKAVVDRALALERELWSGEPQGEGPTPAETALGLEGLTRAILKDAACGHLGGDLRSTADEILLADGFAVGEGAAEQRGATAEWNVVEGEHRELAGERETDADQTRELETATTHAVFDAMPKARRGELDPEPGTRDEELRVVKVPARRGRTLTKATSELEEETVYAEPAREPESDVSAPGASPVLRLIEQTRSERAARADRVANLFPRPETVEWNVRELGYDRDRARAS